MAFVDLYWIPLGAGGPRAVRVTRWAFERVARATPLHAALVAEVDGARWTVEVAPSPDADEASRGVVATGPVGARWAGRWRVFRYEVRCWRGGTIPDLAHAVLTQRLTEDPVLVARVLHAVREVPTPVWNLRWNSNSMVAWVLARSALADGVGPPAGSRAPGWRAGLA